MSIPGDPRDWDEDCLNLNVWTPGLDDRRRPVLVWIHGGGFTTGAGSSAVYSGDRLARRGDVVVVTFNYRLGALGFLSHPTLRDEGTGAEDCGNWGLWDQLAALEWVQEHIGAFGGDPSNVTVFGESAGAMSICALLATHACGKSFHKAVIQSGPPATGSVSWGRARAERFQQLADSPGDPSAPTAPSRAKRFDGDESAPPRRARFDRSSICDLSAEDLVRATEKLAQEAPRGEGLPLPLLPVVDGGLLERPPADAVADGVSAGVPVLMGTTRDEAALFVAMDPSSQGLEIDDVVHRVSKVSAPEAARCVVHSYRDARMRREESVTARDLWTAIVSDYVFRLPSLSFADSAYKHESATFAYLFTWESPFLGGMFGSSHGLDIPFVFGTVEDEAVAMFSGSGPEASALSGAMQDAWLSFARSGDPSCEALGNWPAYDPLRRPTMMLGAKSEVVDDPRRTERLAWDEAGVTIAAGHHHDI